VEHDAGHGWLIRECLAAAALFIHGWQELAPLFCSHEDA